MSDTKFKVSLEFTKKVSYYVEVELNKMNYDLLFNLDGENISEFEHIHDFVNSFAEDINSFSEDETIYDFEINDLE